MIGRRRASGTHPPTVVIAAGGTGGHVYPALAVAECLRRESARVIWLGTAAGLEARVVPRHGFDFHTVRVTGLRSGTWQRRSGAPLRFVLALGAARRCLRRHRAAAVLGMGGYASAPGALAARLLGLPLVLHEQNAVPGMVNRWLGPWANRVLEAVPGAFSPRRRAIHVGNPVREEILEVPGPEDRLASRNGPLRVLVLGGSQGARILNQVVPQAVARLKTRTSLSLRHQSGRGNVERTRARYAGVGFDVVVEEFIENMASAYAWADVVVCRAGALTVAELSAARRRLDPGSFPLRGGRSPDSQRESAGGGGRGAADSTGGLRRLAARDSPAGFRAKSKPGARDGQRRAAPRGRGRGVPGGPSLPGGGACLKCRGGAFRRGVRTMTGPASARFRSRIPGCCVRAVCTSSVSEAPAWGASPRCSTLSVSKSPGSDLAESGMTRHLGGIGVRVHGGHRPAHVAHRDVVVRSAAVPDDNIELEEARVRGIPILPRAQMLAELMRFRHGIAVAGTHGKTTTTSLVTSVLAEGGLDPTCVIGGRLNSIGSNARLGEGPYLVAEADESDRSFLRLQPVVAVVTNIDADHMEAYGNDFGQLGGGFRRVSATTALLRSCRGLRRRSVHRIAPAPDSPRGAHLRICSGVRGARSEAAADGMRTAFRVLRRGRETLDVSLNLPGRHNVYNALAAIAVATELEVADDAIRSACTGFRALPGASRCTAISWPRGDA